MRVLERSDEIYCQLCCVVTNNPSVESRQRGWMLHLLCAGCFLPSIKVSILLAVSLGNVTWPFFTCTSDCWLTRSSSLMYRWEHHFIHLCSVIVITSNKWAGIWLKFYIPIISGQRSLFSIALTTAKQLYTMTVHLHCLMPRTLALQKSERKI